LGMVEARLAGLPPEARRLLRAASVFGEVFWKNGLLNLLGEDALAVDATLEQMVDHEFVTKRSIRRFAGEDEYGFRHALVREGAYAMLAERDRTLGHKLAGDWLERVGEPDPVVLAEHFERSGMRGKAARYHVRAAERALRGNDLQAAIIAAQRGLSAESGGDLEADLWAMQAQAAWLMGNHALAVTAAEQAMQRAAVGSVSYCWALAAGLSAAMMLGRVDAIGVFMGALMTTEPTPDAVAVMAWALTPAVSALVFGGQQGPAAIFLNRLKSLAAANDSQPSVVGSMELAAGFWERFVTRNIQAALKSDTSAEHHFGLAGDQSTTVLCSKERGTDCALLGAFDEAESHLRAILDRVRTGTMPALLATFAMVQLVLDKGAYEEAVVLAERALEQCRLQGESLVSSAAHLVLADAWIAQNQLDMARDALDKSGAGASGLYLNDMWALGIRARLLLAGGRSVEAAEQAENVIAMERKAGVYDTRFDAILLTRAEAYHAAGNIEAAKVAIREVRDDLLARADMIDDPKYRRSFLQQVRVHARILELAKAWLGDET
jgi:eukaryotic-like serine/threonine-protein kinase